MSEGKWSWSLWDEDRGSPGSQGKGSWSLGQDLGKVGVHVGPWGSSRIYDPGPWGWRFRNLGVHAGLESRVVLAVVHVTLEFVNHHLCRSYLVAPR